jgi:hypothetical protein
MPTYVQEWKHGIRVAARFPQDLDTHSSDQVFWFDREGLLVRHEYRAEILGWWATGAHFTSEYRRSAGLLVSTHGQVYARWLTGRDSASGIISDAASPGTEDRMNVRSSAMVSCN